jgi:hypothetical protein
MDANRKMDIVQIKMRFRRVAFFFTLFIVFAASAVFLVGNSIINVTNVAHNQEIEKKWIYSNDDNLKLMLAQQEGKDCAATFFEKDHGRRRA